MPKKKTEGEKRHPKPQGDGSPDKFVPADRPDQVIAGDDDQPGIVDVLELGQEGADGGVNLDSRTEGDARELGTEDSGERRAARVDDEDEDHGDRRDRRDRDNGDGGYSRRVRARVNRERAIARGLREKLDQETTVRQQLEARLAKVEAGQVDAATAADIKGLETQIAQTVEQLEAATEAGETKKCVALQMKLSDLQGDLKLAKYKAEQARAAAATRTTTTDTSTTTRATRTDEDEPEIAEFMEANSHWWNRSRYRKEQRFAVMLDNEILEEIKSGDVDFEKYSPEHFEELGRRLKQRYPDLEVCDLEGNPITDEDENDEGSHVNQRSNGNRKGGRAPVGGMGTRGGRRQNNEVGLAAQGKVNLTPDDFREMRIFNLDPNNPEHKKRFARERLRTIRTTGRGVRDNAQ